MCPSRSFKGKRYRHRKSCGRLFHTLHLPVCVCRGKVCALSRVCVDHQRAAVKTPERQGSAHPHSGAATHKPDSAQNNDHKKKKKDSEKISCLFRLPVTPGNPGTERNPIPARACLQNPRDPLRSIQRHVKFIPPHAASQRALDSDWRAPEAKGGVCAADPTQSGVCLCGVHLNQQGLGPKRPLVPFLHHLSTTSHWHGRLHTLPLTGVYEAGGAFTPPNVFSFPVAPTVLQ